MMAGFRPAMFWLPQSTDNNRLIYVIRTELPAGSLRIDSSGPEATMLPQQSSPQRRERPVSEAASFKSIHDEKSVSMPSQRKRRASNVTEIGQAGRRYVDYKNIEDLRRLMTPNGKIHSRKRQGVSAGEQRMVSQAIKRARYMGLLPYTSATL